eukprot:TRINITY_DN6360_c0_g1_i1.p1 TRINITY_DN6360_c0_g1~~TRINITY_DN6360_c0_g1_i1.p1  ORF type:complete len:283 (+),score=59.56 TRINITY_DN6360_c0_g1_i1:67-849(+)
MADVVSAAPATGIFRKHTDQQQKRGSVSWDEEAIAEAEREAALHPRMKIEMPDTPFLYYDSRAEPEKQFHTAEPADRVDGPDGPVPLSFDADALQRRLGLVKLLREAEDAFVEEHADATAAKEREHVPTTIEVKRSCASVRKAAAELLSCSKRVILHAAGVNAVSTAVRVWQELVSVDQACLHAWKTGMTSRGQPELTLTMANPYVALEVDRKTGASIPTSEFEAKRRALYTDQAANFKKMLAMKHDDDDDGSPRSAQSP